MMQSTWHKWPFQSIATIFSRHNKEGGWIAKGDNPVQNYMRQLKIYKKTQSMEKCRRQKIISHPSDSSVLHGIAVLLEDEAPLNIKTDKAQFWKNHKIPAIFSKIAQLIYEKVKWHVDDFLLSC